MASERGIAAGDDDEILPGLFGSAADGFCDVPMDSLENEKPLSAAVKELEQGKIRILAEDQDIFDGQDISDMANRYVEENIPTEEEARAIIEERAEAAGEDQ